MKESYLTPEMIGSAIRKIREDSEWSLRHNFKIVHPEEMSFYKEAYPEWFKNQHGDTG